MSSENNKSSFIMVHVWNYGYVFFLKDRSKVIKNVSEVPVHGPQQYAFCHWLLLLKFENRFQLHIILLCSTEIDTDMYFYMQ